MQKNLIWRRISLFALTVILCFQVIVSAFPMGARAEENKNLYTTSISEDFEALGVNKSLYPKNANGKPSCIYFTEHCFSKESSYLDEGYNLFFWIYNPTENPIIQICQNHPKGVLM